MNNLRKFRVKKLMTQRDLVEASGVSQPTISFAENNLGKTMRLTQAKLAKALNVPREKIFPPSSSMPIEETKNNLRNYRLKKPLSQKELALRSGVSKVTISSIENDKKNTTKKTQRKLAKALGVKRNKLFPRSLRSN